jgi:hypothetical protein
LVFPSIPKSAAVGRWAPPTQGSTPLALLHHATRADPQACFPNLALASLPGTGRSGLCCGQEVDHPLCVRSGDGKLLETRMEAIDGSTGEACPGTATVHFFAFIASHPRTVLTLVCHSHPPTHPQVSLPSGQLPHTCFLRSPCSGTCPGKGKTVKKRFFLQPKTLFPALFAGQQLGKYVDAGTLTLTHLASPETGTQTPHVHKTNNFFPVSRIVSGQGSRLFSHRPL